MLLFTRPQISEEHTLFFRENGYLVVHNALSPDEIDEVRRATVEVCRNHDAAIRGAAVAQSGETDDEVMQRYLCIHFAHKISSPMYRALAHPVIVDVLTHVIGPNVKAMQSMLFIKAAGQPGQAWHQDEDYIPTRDRSLCGGWIALDDATVENGCLWVIPGSHRRGILWPQARNADPRFDCNDESFNFPYSDADSIPVEVKAGAVVFFNGYLLHRSLPNRAKGGYRRALVNHYMSAESLLPWLPPADGQRVAISDYRDIIIVAGKDPYAYKGIESIVTPHVRESGAGGCGDAKMNLKNPDLYDLDEGE